MAFETERETEYWMKSMWAKMPFPDGTHRLVENTRQMWANYWFLRDGGHYGDSDLVGHALQLSQSRALPYEIGFLIAVYSLPLR